MQQLLLKKEILNLKKECCNKSLSHKQQINKDLQKSFYKQQDPCIACEVLTNKDELNCNLKESFNVKKVVNPYHKTTTNFQLTLLNL